MKKKTTIITFVFSLFSMLFFMYGIWVAIECTREVKALIAENMVNMKTDAFKVAGYVLFDKGLASLVFYCLATFGLGQLLKEDKASTEQEKS